MEHPKEIITAGKKLAQAKKALIMLHGRGASAEDILSLAPHLNLTDFAILAPQASNASWYPYSFLVSQRQNEPWLSSALNLVADLTNEVTDAGIPYENIYFSGFSQGACLTLEFVTRNANRWGGVAAFSGGLIGDHINPQQYGGNFNGTPVFIGSSDPDPHIPVERVQTSASLIKEMGASVTLKIYPNMGHTVSMDEIAEANKLIFKKS
jgi:phospholipase/carboxylesterase